MNTNKTKILDKKYNLLNYCEIDKYASKAYSLIHKIEESKNLGDITKIDVDSISDNIDLVVWGFPCTDISIAGKQKGFIDDEGKQTRSGLYYEGIKIIKAKKPKISIIENVKNLTSKKFSKEFEMILNDLSNIGYNNYYKVLDSKNYGIPQHRERVFIISIRKDIDNNQFEFPQPFELRLCLKDLLEKSVDEKYFLNEKQLSRIITSSYISNQRRINRKKYADTLCSRDYKDPKCVEIRRLYGIYDTEKRKHQCGEIFDQEGLSPTLNTAQGGLTQPCIEILKKIKKGYKEDKKGDDVYLNRTYQKRGTVQNGIIQMPKIVTDVGVAVKNEFQEELRVRKLTPKEYWRLMGFDDQDVDICIESGISNTQLYKMAGNSIVVDVLYYIFIELYKALPQVFENMNYLSLFSGIGAPEKALDRLYKKINDKGGKEV